jgi:crossover junction endodeoxyribonuclease RuvC
MPDKTILSLDLGTKTGWALLSKGKVTSGTENLNTYSKLKSKGVRFLKFKNFLENLGKQKNIDVVYYEDVKRHLGTYAAHCYGGFLAHLSVWCEENKIPCCGVGVGTIKKSVAGNGRATKNEIIESLKSQGYSTKDDNEADAVALLLLAIDTEKKKMVENIYPIEITEI